MPTFISTEMISSLNKSAVGLSNVDNTSDANKPVSTAVQNALDTKASTATVTTTADGLMVFSDKVKLNSIAAGATVNDTDANLKSRANHTGTQAISTIVNLQSTLDSKLTVVNPVSSGVSRNKASSWPNPINSVSTTATYNGTNTIQVGDGSQVSNGDAIFASFVSQSVYVVSGGGTNTIVMSRAATGSGSGTVTFGTDRWDLSSTTLGDTAGYRRLYLGAAARGRSTLQPQVNGQGLDYQQVTTFACENENGGVAGWFGSRMSLENTGLASLISLGTYCLIDEDPVNRHSWNGYDQSNLRPGTAPTGSA